MDRRTFIGAVAGNLVAVPVAAMAQQKAKVRRIGILSPDDEPGSNWREVLLPPLRDLGWIEGQNLIVESRFADNKVELLRALAAELVRLKVELIVTNGTPATIAAKKATASIPIVMWSAGDPVGSGLVASLAHPGGNVTGNSLVSTELRFKRLQLLHELLPAATRVGELMNPGNPVFGIARDEYEQAYRSLRIQPIFVEASAASQLENAVAEVAHQRGQALIVDGDPLFSVNYVQLMSAVLRYELPTLVEDNTDSLEAGGLVLFTVSDDDTVRRAAAFIDKILRGARPADLPVEQPTKFQLIINLKTAKALGITIPQSVLLRADRVIQ
jgi:putative ABC transport system substrate-binding protein